MICQRRRSGVAISRREQRPVGGRPDFGHWQRRRPGQSDQHDSQRSQKNFGGDLPLSYFQYTGRGLPRASRLNQGKTAPGKIAPGNDELMAFRYSGLNTAR